MSKSRKPLVSIVLPVYNGEKYLAQSIESVRWQTLQEWELIIVNDGSTDGSADIIKKYAELDNRIRVINNGKNKNLPASLNIGFAAARGKFLTWNSDDNMYLPQALEKMASFLQKNPTFYAVNARMTQIDDDGKYERMFDAYDPFSMWVYDLMGLCFMYRREVKDKIGGFDEGLFLVEDYDYWLRILEECGPIGTVNEVQYIYRCHQNSLTVKRKYDVAMALQRLRKKHLPHILKNIRRNTLALHLIYESFVFYGESRYIQERIKKVLPGVEKERFDFPENGKYIVLGTDCTQTEETLKKLGDKVESVVGITDDEVGQERQGKKIISFRKALQEVQNGAILLIAVPLAIHYEVVRQIAEAGIPEYRSCWWGKRKKFL